MSQSVLRDSCSSLCSCSVAAGAIVQANFLLDTSWAASFSFARQAAPGCAVFSYHQVAVIGRWAFVFGHAIEALEKSGGYQLDGRTAIHSSTETELVTIVVAPR